MNLRATCAQLSQSISFAQLGSRWRAERALAELARAGGRSRSPGARVLAGLVLMETAAPQDLEELAAGLSSARYRAGELVQVQL